MSNTTDQIHETKLRTYADDWRRFTQGLRRKAAHDIVGSFVTASDELRRTGMTVFSLASGSSARAVLRQVADAFGTQVAVHVKDLGVDDTLTDTRRVPAQRKRIGNAITSAGRIARLPHGWKSMARLTASLSRNQSRWGVDVTGLPGHAAGHLRSAHVRAISGGNAARRAPEVILALVARRAFLDPALGLTRQVILSWAKRVAMDPPCWSGSPKPGPGRWTNPPPQGSPGGQSPRSSPSSASWGGSPRSQGCGTRERSPGACLTLRGCAITWTGPWPFPPGKPWRPGSGTSPGQRITLTRKRPSRSPKALDDRRNTSFGRYACIPPGNTWTRDRHSRAGFDVDPCCPLCQDTKETPVHRWWVCPRWDVLKSPESLKLACLRAAADWQPKRLRECGLLPSPAPGDCPPAPPTEVECGKPKQRKLLGKYLIYADASAMRPKDPYLRRAACAFWAGDRRSDSAAWSLPGPIQTVYRAELFAVLVAREPFQGDLEIVSDCKGVLTEAERMRAGSKVSPTSKHTDL